MGDQQRTYRARVRARNRVGAGPWSPLTTLVLGPTRRGTGTALRATATLADATGAAVTIVRHGAGTAVMAHATLAAGTGVVTRRGTGTALRATATLADATGTAVTIVRRGVGTAVRVYGTLGGRPAVPRRALTLEGVPLRLRDRYLVLSAGEEETTHG